MIFKTFQLPQLLELPEFPAEIIRRGKKGSSNETLIYKFYVLVDTDNAVRRDALNLKVSLYKKKPEENPAPKVVKRARSWNRATKRLERNAQKALKRRVEKRLAFRSVDLSNYISNDLARLRTKKPVTRQEKNSLSARNISVTLRDPFTASRASFSKPTTPGVFRPRGIAKKKKSQPSLSSTVIQGVSTKPPAPQKFSKSVLSIKKDPASISSASQKSFSRGTMSPVMKMKISDVVFTPPRSLPELSSYRVIPKKQLISFKVMVRRSALSSAGSFYLDLELENEKGVKVSQAGVQIPHARILNAYLTPRYAPIVEAEYIKPGKISVSLEKHRKDHMCTRMKVFRRLAEINQGVTDRGSPWVEIFDEPVEETGTFVFRDSIATSKAVVYRAVSYGENSKPSEKFSSTVVMPLKQFRVKQSGALTAIPTLITSSKSTSVEVYVKDIPDDVITIMLKRFNKTTDSDAQRKASKGAGFAYVGDTPVEQSVFARDIKDDGSVLFVDRSVKSGNNYMYVPVGITMAGKEITGSSAPLEIPFSPGSPKVSIRVSSARVQPRTLSVSIDLDGKFTDFGFSEIRSSLAAAQQEGLFASDLLEDRDKFESLINFLVERENSKTGELESFGVYELGTFSDDQETRAEKNIKDLERGTEYTYIITALLNSPETLFPTLTRKEIDTRTLLPFSRRVAKFQNPLAFARATLASTQRQKTPGAPSPLEPNDPLLAGRTNVQTSKAVRIPLSPGQQPTVTIEKHKRFNRVVWVSNDVDDIDHFKVYVLSSGGRVLIDTVHCDAATSEFYYRHYDKDYAVEYQYMIQPVSLSYKDLKPILAKKVKPYTISRLIGMKAGFKLTRI